MRRAKTLTKIYFEGHDQTIEDFLNSQKPLTARGYRVGLRLVFSYQNWLDDQPNRKISGAEMIASKRADKNYMWEKNAIQFKIWLKKQTTKRGGTYSDNSVDAAVMALRSFFDYYRTALNFSQSEGRKLNGRNKRKTIDYQLTNDVLKHMTAAGDLREKYVVLVGKSVGLRVSDFIKFTWGTFRSLDLTGEPPIFMGEIITEKEGVSAFPFLDADATPIIQMMLDANKDKPDSERILDYKEERQVTVILQRLAKTANIPLGGKHLRFHCFRKYLIDRLSAYMSESKWKQIVGKAISEGAYVSTLELRECYAKASASTVLNGSQADSYLQRKVAKLEEKIKRLENAKPALEALLRKVEFLEAKLNQN